MTTHTASDETTLDQTLADVQRDRLRTEVLQAIAEIAQIRCPDPAAVDAFLTARLTMHTLREVWLPNI